MYKVLVINLGSTSSKIAYYEGKECKIKETIEHSPEVLAQFGTILEQYEYRKNTVLRFMEKHQIDGHELNAIASRGGHTHPIEGGTYVIDTMMVEEIKTGNFGRHACDLGVFIAKDLSEEFGILPTVTDPPVTDEFQKLARYSGLPGLERKSSFHALNQRAVARKYVADAGVQYEDINLIVVHMGGGISVVAHEHGKMIDANNALDGDGPFSTNRTGALPVGALVKLCFSGKYTETEVKKMLNGKGGTTAYIGENDLRVIQKAAFAGNEAYKDCMDAMLYQTCKEIGAQASVLYGQVNAIVLTGGMVYSEYVVDYIKAHCSYIAPVHVYAGEYEMKALALGAMRVLDGTCEEKYI